MLTIIQPDYCFGSWKNVAFSVWHGELKNIHIPIIKREWTSVQAAHPEGFGVITIVAADAQGIDKTARKDVSDLYEGFGKALRGASIVLDNMPGMKGTAARFIISSLRLVSGATYPFEAHESLSVAAKWIGEQLKMTDPFGEISKMIEEYEAKRKLSQFLPK